jgi:diguanylate cyclase
MTIVAEGVETLDQLRFLKFHECDDAQGYFISRPLTADAFALAYAQWDSTSAEIVSAAALQSVI